MFGRKKLTERLNRIEQLLVGISEAVNTDQRLVKQNEGLLDRLMSRNWETYAQNSPDVLNRFEGKDVEIIPNPLEDEGNIGEVLSDEEIGQ